MSEDPAHVRQLQANLSQCLRTVDAVAAELRSLKARLGPAVDDVQRVIGGTAQGTDAQMVASLEGAARGLDNALDLCAAATTMTRRLSSAL